MKSNAALQICKWTINAFGQIIICSILLLVTGGSSKSDDATQTLVFIRHGEKPKEGLGQLLPGSQSGPGTSASNRKLFWPTRCHLCSKPVR